MKRESPRGLQTAGGIRLNGRYVNPRPAGPSHHVSGFVQMGAESTCGRQCPQVRGCDVCAGAGT